MKFLVEIDERVFDACQERTYGWKEFPEGVAEAVRDGVSEKIWSRIFAPDLEEQDNLVKVTQVVNIEIVK